MIQIVRANKVNNVRKDISKLFVNSFYYIFSSFCNDKNKLEKAFNHIFALSLFYVVLLDNKVIGIGACSDGSSSIHFNKFKLCVHLGFKRGNAMYKYLKSIFEDRDYDFDMDNMCGMIEFVTVDSNYLNSNIGYILVNHMMHDNKYIRYLAKVANNNYRGIKLFEKIGFEEFHKENASSREMGDFGVTNYIYYIYSK